jgi:hypothetical protein
VKAYILRPNIDVFDGTGTLAPHAASALQVIAEMVADCLEEGGDTSHHATVSYGPAKVGTPPNVVPLPDRQSLVTLALRLLNPNDLLGGDIRSVVNCRTATFGQDGQAMLCLRHEDTAPLARDASLVSAIEYSDRLAGSDLFDGGWPSV